MYRDFIERKNAKREAKEAEPEFVVPNLTFKSVVRVKWARIKRMKRNARRSRKLWLRRLFFRWWRKVWGLHWMQLWRISSRDGSKKGRKPAWPFLFSTMRAAVKRTSAFFRYAPSDGFLFFWTLTGEKTVRRNKKPTSWESEPHIYAIGQTSIFYPIYQPPCSRKGRRNFLYKITAILPQYSAFWSC